ncbi:M3 family metallopeptidase [Moraxella nasibovis]|uniref:M3 family metallopeptidase n=1 Tax=Moraxella nasibovis TaxID=2904120 RepID=UPI002410706B|nr:M3 family metallopeptidase [Moraxella nasibovis]WFF38776.1 M3 family metallopeptidase [Moraxella nasibovis]
MSIDFYSPDFDERLRLVDFGKTTPQTLTQQTQAALDTAHAFLDDIENGKADGTALHIIDEFDRLSHAIHRPFGVLSHLNSVMNSDEIRHAHHEILPKLSEFGVRVGQSKALYELYKSLEHTLDSTDIARIRAVKLALQSFDLSGVGLPDDKKKAFADIQSELSLLSAKFSDNVLDATGAFALPLTEAQLDGITPSGLALLKAAGDNYKAKHPNATLPTDYVATLDIPMYLAVMQYATDRTLRETLYHAYNTRASGEMTFTGEKDGQPSRFDNSDTMARILKLRTDKAKLLGFDDYTQVSLATKMADSHDEIEKFLLNLADKARPFAKADLAEVEQFAKTLGIDEVKPWDIPFISEKLQNEKYSLDSEAIRAYFPVPVVLDGLFDIIDTLFGVRFVAKDAPVWHKDAQFYEVHGKDGLIGGAYIDLYARSGKSGGAWLSDFQGKHTSLNGQETLPVCFVVGNFSPAVDGKPSLLTHDEVLTLFHEFGHALHHLLTKVTISDVSGINGVEWDAVELPSQFMENFAWDKAGIAKISRHVETGDALPDDKLTAMLSAKNFQSGLQALRQIEFGVFDLRIHAGNFERYEEILDTQNQVRQAVAVITPPANNRFANSFSHIFAGGYASGYYSYKWAELLSADAFGVFEEHADGVGVLNPAIGQRFYDNILAMGGSRTAKENFIAFAGREAKIDALLRHSGFGDA